MLNREIDFEKPSTDKTISPELSTDGQSLPSSPIKVLVSNGDLKYASWPVLAGHFLNDGILFAEKAIDRYLAGELTKRHHLGLYPGDIGTCEIIIPNGAIKFRGSIIVGLGKQGLLTAYQLMQTVEQAVTKYLAGIISNSNLNGKKEDHQKVYGISSLIIGCSYGGLTIENSIRAIIQGVFNSNNKIRHTFLDKARAISFIEFVEQYRDRALSCVYSLSRIEKDETQILDIQTSSPRIKKLFGAKDRLPVDNSGEWWTRISVRVNYISNGEEKKKSGIRFTMTTDGAREEERFLYTDSETLEQMLEELSANNNWSPQLARTMFELLIPNDFKDQVKKQNNIIWILDKVTASYPWELLQDSAVMAKPISVNAGMIRQLATEDYRIKISPVIKPNAIIISDPDLKGSYPQLPGARMEGRAVKEILDANGYTVSLKEGSSASEIMLSMFSDTYKIVHLAAHGVFNPEPDKPRGMMIGPNAWFTSHEFHQMSTVPELVFVNCCYLGKSEGDTEEYYRNRYKLAANIGTQLIENGVKAVIVTGWAVEDNAALSFTRVFYENLFSGDNFGESVRKARKVVYDDFSASNNTWGAYQCYGDPFFTLQGSQAQNVEREYDFVIAQEAEIELSNLYNQLETGAYSYDSVGEIVKKIAEAVDRQNLRNGRITELEALIYYELNIYEESMKKYASLLKEEKASFSFSAVEQYCNIRSKYYVNQILKQGRKPEDFSLDFDMVIDQLQGLAKLTETVERLNLLGSTWKRKAIITEGKKKLEAYREAEKYYKKATEAAGELNRYYSLTNYRCLEKALALVKPALSKKGGEGNPEYDPAPAIDSLRKLLEANATRISNEMNYWDMIADANMKLALLILGDTETVFEKVHDSYSNAWNEAGNPGQKEAELEQFHFLTDLFSMSEHKEAKRVVAMIKKLQEKLGS